MKIILNNGLELEPMFVVGERRYVQRESRDTLTFVFPSNAGLEDLDAAFTADDCEHIRIVESENASYIHNGYTIRAELSLKPVQVVEPTDETEAVYEDRIFVSMAQRTDMEDLVAETNAALNALATGEE